MYSISAGKKNVQSQAFIVNFIQKLMINYFVVIYSHPHRSFLILIFFSGEHKIGSLLFHLYIHISEHICVF